MPSSLSLALKRFARQTPGASSSPPPRAPMPAPLPPQSTQSLPSSPKSSSPPYAPHKPPISRSSRGLGSTPLPASSFSTSAFQTPLEPRTSLSTSSPIQQRPRLSGQTLHPRSSLSVAPPLVPQQSSPNFSTPTSAFQAPKPNYNISLTATPMIPTMSSPPVFNQVPPLSGGILAPSNPLQPTWPTGGTTRQVTKDDWGDFDPLA